MELSSLVKRLVGKKAKRTEADIQADIRQLLLQAPLDLKHEDLEDIRLESPVGDRRRIDIEIGSTVIEVKKNLRRGNVLAEATLQLKGYVESRMIQTEENYIGILSDGAEWLCFHLNARKEFVQISSHSVHLTNPDSEALIIWLDGVLATKSNTPPTPMEIDNRLGAKSSSHAINYAVLSDLYEQYKDLPTIQMKRTLWAKLLTTALGSHFQDNDSLFIEHTLLVNSSEVIAHAVLGLDANLITPGSLLSGTKFEESGIYGVVENNFLTGLSKFQEARCLFAHWHGRSVGLIGKMSHMIS